LTSSANFPGLAQFFLSALSASSGGCSGNVALGANQQHSHSSAQYPYNY
jgi:hypothetical protein